MTSDLRILSGCPACGTAIASARSLFKVSLLGEPSRVVKCSACGLVYKALSPTSTGLEKIYSAEYSHFNVPREDGDMADEMSATQKFVRCERLLERKPGSSRLRLLDIGCGSGGFVEFARRRGYDAIGIDPFLPSQLQSSFLRKAAPEEVEPQTYDVALALNVAEHVPDPRALFSAIYSLLKPGGVLLVTCPYGNSFAMRAYRDRWIHMILDEHLLFWTYRSLTSLLRTLQFSGRVSWRISGSPFPFGRAPVPVPLASPDACQCDCSPVANPRLGLQSHVWRWARRAQRTTLFANAIRSFVHLTRSGDYLELAIAKSA